MMYKKTIIGLIFLGIISCIISGLARLMSNLFVSDPWIEGIVGLGMGGTLLFLGILGLVWVRDAPGIARKIGSAVSGILGLVLAIIIFISAIQYF